jgi:hypothetical protein
MTVFIVSFDLKYDDTYQDRYKSFMEQVKKGGDYWDDTTSCVVVRTNESIDEFCTRIYVNSDFNATKDLYLVLDAHVKAGRIRGAIKSDKIFKLLDYVKKL